MKIIIISITIMSCLLACKKNSIPKDHIYDYLHYGEASFLLNGFPETKFLPYAKFDRDSFDGNNVTINLVKYNENFYPTHKFHFGAIKFKTATYDIKHSQLKYNNTGPSFTNSGFWVVTDIAGHYYYKVDSTKPCVLNITKVDSVTKEIWGNFKGVYELPINTQLPHNAVRIDTITNGIFHTKILL